jgi:hypothetical protein
MLLDHNTTEVTPILAAPVIEDVITPAYLNLDSELEALYDLMPNHVNRAHLTAVVMRGLEAKKHLVPALGLGPDHRARFTIPAIDAVTANPRARALANFMLSAGLVNNGPDAYAAIALNEMALDEKRTMRLTKFLTRAFADKDKGAGHREAWEQTRRSYYNIPETETFEATVSRVMDEMASASIDVVISANPLDILLASERCGYTSCYQFSGCHANGAIACAIDSFTVIAFLDSSRSKAYPFHKRGRMFAYIPDFKRFVIANTYGNVATAQVRLISERISTALAQHLALPNTWKAKSRDVHGGDDEDATLYYPEDLLENAGGRSVTHTAHDQFPVYFDAPVSRVVVHKSVLTEGAPKVRDHRPLLSFEDAICLVCGTRTCHNEGLACGACRRPAHSCCECGNDLDEDYVENWNDNTYCSGCLGDVTFICDCCDERHSNEASNSTVRSGLVCDSCFEDDFIQCEDCEEGDRHDYSCHIAGHGHVCRNCAHDYGRCSDCGDRYASLTPVGAINGVTGDYRLCDGCRERHADCAECSETWEVAHLQHHEDDDAPICPDCYRDRTATDTTPNETPESAADDGAADPDSAPAA